ncbi:MAG: hypothetical protein E7662_10470 [Ruminococcaceae bacterium]|nr:hypothetical protein [Oscillospiraceae bacterium]
MTYLEETYTETVRTVVRQMQVRKEENWTLTSVLSETTAAGRRYYSITAAVGKDEAAEDICTVSDITGDPAEAERIFRMITDGFVMPCTLEDVISDILG